MESELRMLRFASFAAFRESTRRESRFPFAVSDRGLARDTGCTIVRPSFQRGLYRACDVPSETSPEPSGLAGSGSDSCTASRVEAVWNASV